MKLDDGCLDRVDRVSIWVVGHDSMEYARNILFRACEMLSKEYGLSSKVFVDRERPAFYRDLSCTNVSVKRGGARRRHTDQTEGRAALEVRVGPRPRGRVGGTCAA